MSCLLLMISAQCTTSLDVLRYNNTSSPNILHIIINNKIRIQNFQTTIYAYAFKSEKIDRTKFNVLCGIEDLHHDNIMYACNVIIRMQVHDITVT